MGFEKAGRANRRERRGRNRMVIEGLRHGETSAGWDLYFLGNVEFHGEDSYRDLKSEAWIWEHNRDDRGEGSVVGRYRRFRGYEIRVVADVCLHVGKYKALNWSWLAGYIQINIDMH
jgi:hypothetical protein